MAYMSLREYAKEHGIRVLNATRGGKLEVFERVNFDKLMNPGSIQGTSQKKGHPFKKKKGRAAERRKYL